MKNFIIFILAVANLGTAKGQYSATSCGTSMLISTGTFATTDDDALSDPLPIPFSFEFYGTVYPELYVSTNGFITFNGTSSGCCEGYILPDSHSQPYIALAHTDLGSFSAIPGTPGSIYYDTVGIAPNRVFVVHFQGVSDCCSMSEDVTGEIQLYETSNEIKIISSSITTGNNATMGVAKGDNLESTVIAGRNSVVFTSGSECWSLTNSPLPLKLINFSGMNNGKNSNILNWTTADEINMKSFEVQRSTNGLNFEKVYSVDASVNSLTIKNYTYNDIFNFLGGAVYYYRLKMIDQDRVYSYSPVVVLRKKSDESIHVSPNPFIDKILLNIESVDEDNARISLTEINGRIILQQKNSIRAGNNAIQLNPSENIQKGTYLLKVSTSKKSETIKILKL